MLNPFKKLLGRNPAIRARTFVFFILFFLYLWLEVDLRLIYYGSDTITNFPVFYRGWDFFKDFIAHPGGPVEYLSAFLSQFFYISWAGVVIVTIQAWLICVCVDVFIKTINADRLRFIRFVPPILLLVLYTRYTYHFVTTMSLTVALLFVCLYLRVTKESGHFDLLSFLSLSGILYYIAGGAYLLFAVLCVIYELLFRRRVRISLLYSLFAAVIPYVGGVFVSGVSIVEAFTDLLPFSPKVLVYETRRKMVETVYLLYLLLPLASLGLGLWRILVKSPALSLSESGTPPMSSDKVKKGLEKKPRRRASGPGKRIFSWYFRSSKIRWVIESCLLLVIAGSIVFPANDNELKTLFEADYYAYHRMWPQVLEAYHHHPSSFLIVNAVNRALYHTGRLSSDMFSYPQHPDTLFLTSKEYLISHWRKADIFIDLGVMNMGESALAESIERLGERPVILKRLALINMVKGNIGAARIYLGALSKTLFYADWANDYINRLQSDPNLSTDDRIQNLRSLMLKEDYGFTRYDPEKILLALLEKNRKNNMAFEYLMAWYLLTGQLDKFVHNLNRLDDFNYKAIPRHYEEAILIYEVLTGSKVNLKGRNISQRTQQRARGFSDICLRFPADSKGTNIQAMLATARDYGDTYFFYYNFGSLLIIKK